MALFGLFKRPKHRKFDFIPRYYDPEKEDLENRLKKFDPIEKDNPELIKHRIRSGFRSRTKVDGNYRRTSVRKSNMILIAIILILLLLSYFFIMNYLPKIIETLG
jgi:hypothetical protein